MKIKPLAHLLTINSLILVIPFIARADIILSDSIVHPDSIASHFIAAFLITVMLELIVSSIFIAITKKSYNILLYVLFANVISLPIAWFLPVSFLRKIYATIIILEVFIILFESAVIYLLGRKNITYLKSLILSFINNIVSWIAGTLIYYWIWGILLSKI